MLPTLYKVERIGRGVLSIMGRPRAGEWATDEFSGLAHVGVTDVVSLLEPDEAQELGLEDESRYCANVGIEFGFYPVSTDASVKWILSDSSRLSRRRLSGLWNRSM